MKQTVALVTVLGCGGPPRVQAPAAPAMAMATCPAPRDDIAALREQMKTDPVAVMVTLGVQPHDFEPLARRLYNVWSRAFPDEARAMLAAHPAPAPATPAVPVENGVKVYAIDHDYWCFSSKTPAVQFCFADPDVCMGLLTNERNTKNSDDRLCRQHQAAVCFRTRDVVTARSQDWCFDNVSSCRLGTAMLVGKDDALESDCAIMRRE